MIFLKIHLLISITKVIWNILNINYVQRKPVPTPWKSILTSPPVWAITVLGFSFGWGWYVFLACLPSFFKEVLDFNIKEVQKINRLYIQYCDNSVLNWLGITALWMIVSWFCFQNGVLTALPFIASWTIKNLSARFSDLLQKTYGCTFVRKTFSTAGMTHFVFRQGGPSGGGGSPSCFMHWYHYC